MSTPAAPSAPGPRRAYRDVDQRWVGGVAAGLAGHLGVPVLPVRVGFVAASALGGFGAVLYACLWLVLPAERHLARSAPGLEAASRQGRRPAGSNRLTDVGPVVALGAAGIGVVVLLQRFTGGSVWFWPLLLGAVGLAVLWRQADEAQRERWTDSSGRVGFARAVVGGGGAAAYARLSAGVLLLAAALVTFALLAAGSGAGGVTRDVLVAGGLGVGGLALVIGPWLVRLSGDLSEERAERVRSQERADLAAHLHDSVLQTLALIQRHAADPRAVATLARAQERDLRSWLYEETPPAGTSVAGALRSAAAEVEDAYAVPVELVVVGDRPLDEAVAPLVLAAREAVVNAARHSGADRVDVYAECGDRLVEVFVRDRGIGFDETSVPGDRLGLRRSIRDRMTRHGGTVHVRTAPGAGTEVRLSVGAAKTSATGTPGVADGAGQATT